MHFAVLLLFPGNVWVIGSTVRGLVKTPRKPPRPQDIEYDRRLQDVPRLLPSALNLPAITAAEYCANYVSQVCVYSNTACCT